MINQSTLFIAINVIGDVSALQMLLRLGIDLKIRCSIQVSGISQPIEQCTTLNYAVLRRNNLALEALLTSGQDPNIIEFLLTATDNLKMTALHHACSASNWKAVQLLVQHGAPLDTQDLVQKTPLHYASLKAHKGCVQILLQAIKLSYNNYSIINIKDKGGWTPLHRACRNKSLDCIVLLVQHGADIHLLTNEGRSPLQIARGRKHYDVADYLEGLETEIIKEPEEYDALPVKTPLFGDDI